MRDDDETPLGQNHIPKRWETVVHRIGIVLFLVACAVGFDALHVYWSSPYLQTMR